MFSKKNFIICLSMLILFSFAMETPGKTIWNRYENARFGYEIEYPDILLPQEESQNGDGRHFVSDDGKSVLTVYASLNVLELSLQDIYKSKIDDYKKAGKKITYKVIDKDWFVLSGYDGDKVFYVKILRHYLAGENSDIDGTMIMTYPKSQKSTFDKITEKISTSFCFK